MDWFQNRLHGHFALARKQRRDLSVLIQTVNCPPVYHTRERLYTVPLITEHQLR